MKKVRNMTAAQAYATRLEELSTMLLAISNAVDITKEAGASAPFRADLNWGSVGDIGRALELATELQESLRGPVAA